MAEAIGPLLVQVLRRTKQQHGALLTIQARWTRIVGRALATHSRPIRLQRGRLIIAVDRPGDGFTVQYQQRVILARLDRLLSGTVEALSIRPGALDVRKAAHAVSDRPTGRPAGQRHRGGRPRNPSASA